MYQRLRVLFLSLNANNLLQRKATARRVGWLLVLLGGLSSQAYQANGAQTFDITTSTPPTNVIVLGAGLVSPFAPYVATKSENIFLNATMSVQPTFGAPDITAHVLVNGGFIERFRHTLEPNTGPETLTIGSALALNPGDTVTVAVQDNLGTFDILGGPRSKLSVMASNQLAGETFDISTSIPPINVRVLGPGLVSPFASYVATEAENIFLNATMSVQPTFATPDITTRVLVNGGFREQFRHSIELNSGPETLTIGSALALNPGDTVSVALQDNLGTFDILAGRSKLSVMASNEMAGETFDIDISSPPTDIRYLGVGMVTPFAPYTATEAENIFLNATMSVQPTFGSPEVTTHVLVNGGFRERFIHSLEPNSGPETITIGSALALNPGDTVSVMVEGNFGNFDILGGPRSKRSIIASNELIPEPSATILLSMALVAWGIRARYR